MEPWRQYQDKVAEFFRSIGFDAVTDETIRGVRTTHDVDVVVRSEHVGFGLLWLVECKHWSKAVSRLHVLALREIVSDTGADRGILMAEEGFQSGAHEAATLTNVQLTSLAELTEGTAPTAIFAQLRACSERIAECQKRYWNLGKYIRIDHGLRPEVGAMGFSTQSFLRAAEAILMSELSGSTLISSDPLNDWNIQNSGLVGLPRLQLISEIVDKLTWIEGRLKAAEGESQHASVSEESGMQQNTAPLEPPEE